jgi:hypothetical protein
VPPEERVVAVGLLTSSELALLGRSFKRMWPVERTPCFGSLLVAIDEADRAYWQEQDRTSVEPTDE